MLHLADILLGAALVATGVFVVAIGDRIRGVHFTRERVARGPAVTSPRRAATRRDTPTTADGASDAVIGALVTAGYPRRVAVAATAGCAPEQRETVETWTRAALRSCTARGGVT